MGELAAFTATVHGKVQGVNFRWFVTQEATSLGIKGYAHNLPDGVTVEVKAEGEKDKLESLLEKLKVGPPAARVEHLDITWSHYTNSFQDFQIRR